MSAIPLSLAMLCCDCEYVVPLQNECAHCGSEALVMLTRWLDRRRDLVEKEQQGNLL